MAVLPALSTAALALMGAPTPSVASARAPYRRGVVLVAFEPGVSAAHRHAIERAVAGTRASRLGPPIKTAPGRRPLPEPLLLRLRRGTVASAVARLRGLRAVAYAEPDYLMHATAIPNDPGYGSQWANENTGQAVPGQDQSEELGPPQPGTPGADDGAHAAWDVTTGSRAIVVGVVDTGVDFDHPDLAANVWTNPGGVGGCPQGTHGYNALTKGCNSHDEDTTYGGHGTHVAGIIGAVGNNGTGVTGVNWQTTLLPVKWLQNGSSETSAFVTALQWLVAVRQAGLNVRVANDSDSFSGTARSQAVYNAIQSLGENEILFVTSAGNTGNNDDIQGAGQRFPCSYGLPNELCVTTTDNNDQLPSWASYGAHAVDLAAPGVSIYSTLNQDAYGYLTGTSMSAAEVSGAAALMLSAAPWLSTATLRAGIVQSVDALPSLQGKVASGGRLDVCKGITLVSGWSCPPVPVPPAPAPPQASTEVQASTSRRPAIGRLTISPRAFAPARRGAAAVNAKARGAKVTYTDSQPSVARFQLLALRPGFRDRRGRCVVSVRPPGRRASGARRRCTGYLLLGVFSRRDGAGTNRFRLTGRLNGRALASGRYHLRAVPTFRSVSGAAVSAAFSITR